MSSQDYRIETGLVVNGPISADNIPGALSDLTDLDLGTGQQNGETLIWNSSTGKWEPGIPTSTINSIDSIGDVDTSTVAPLDGQALVWDEVADQWKPGTVINSIASIDDIGDVDTSTTPPLDGQALVWDEIADEWKPGTVSGGGAGGSSHLLALDNISSQFTGLETVFTLTQAGVDLPSYVQASDLLLFIGGAIQVSSSFTWDPATSQITFGSPPPSGAYFAGWLTTPPYWTFQAGEPLVTDLIYTQYRVGVGTNGDQNTDYNFVVEGGTQLDDLKVVGNSLIGDGLNEILGEINLIPNESLTLQGQYVRIRPTINADQSHIHIEAGNVDYADLFLGDDDRYVKIDRLGPVSIGVPGATTTSNWIAPSPANTANLTIELATYPWAVDLTISDFITLPDNSVVNIDNLYVSSTQVYLVLSSVITYDAADVIVFTYRPRSIWSFNPDSSADFPGDLTATSFIGDGSELTGIELAGLADVDTTTLAPTTGQGLLWDGLTNKWRPGNGPDGPQGDPGPGFYWLSTYVSGNGYVPGAVVKASNDNLYVATSGGGLGDPATGASGWDLYLPKGDPGAKGDPGDPGEIGFAGLKYDSRRTFTNQYVVGEIIEYGGNYFICLANNDAVVPTGGTIGVYWNPYSLVGPPGSDGDHYHTTSSSTLTISANGQISLTTDDLGLDYSVAQTVIIAHDISHHMHGDVVSYNPVNGLLTVDLKQKAGSGTYSSWNVNLSGPASSSQVVGTINDLNDVDTVTTAPSNGQALIWNSTVSQWKPGTVSGGGGSLGSTTISLTTGTLNPGDFTNLTLAGGSVFNLLAITSTDPVWVRVYGTTTARDADVRTQPGGSPPGSGNDYYAELVTVGTPQTIRFSPVPIVQGTAGNAYVRVKNLDSSAQAITIDFTILTLES